MKTLTTPVLEFNKKLTLLSSQPTDNVNKENTKEAIDPLIMVTHVIIKVDDTECFIETEDIPLSTFVLESIENPRILKLDFPIRLPGNNSLTLKGWINIETGELTVGYEVHKLTGLEKIEPLGYKLKLSIVELNNSNG